MIYDISPPITQSLKVWPGDTPPTREVLSELTAAGSRPAVGASVTLSTLHTTVHVGAHVDAPSHYGVHGASIDEVELDRYLGLCQVVHAAGSRPTVDVARSGGTAASGASVSVEAFKARSPQIEAPRVLIATNTFRDPTVFNEDFAGLSPELIDHLNDSGVRLVGIDTPSVDLFASKSLPVHQRCLRYDMAILEGLVLSGVPDGIYELIALPLRLVGFDGSPVRAVLRDPANLE